MLNRKKLLKYLRTDNPHLYGNLAYKAIKIYQAKYGTFYMAEMIKAYGNNIFKSHWVDQSGKEHYGLDKTADLIRSHYHMAKIRAKQIKRINDYSFYTITKGSSSREAHHISFYTTLVSGVIDKISRHGLWIDVYNQKPVYELLKSFHNKLARQIRTNARFKHAVLLASNTENATHMAQPNIYSHGHNHGIIGITDNDTVVVNELNKVIKADFKAIFGYDLIPPKRNDKKLEPVQPLTYTTGTGIHQRTHHAVLSTKHGSKQSNRLSMKAVDDTTDYDDTDYHLQTKDTSFSDFMKLTPKERHKVVATQLHSTKGMQLNRSISNKAVTKAKVDYDNYKHFIANDRWLSHRKHLTSTEQWSLAQGKAVTSEPNDTKQLSLNFKKPTHQSAGKYALIHAIRAVRTVLDVEYIISHAVNKKAITNGNDGTAIHILAKLAESDDMLVHSGIPP